MIVDAIKLCIRYNGIGRQLSSDEAALLLFALYNESEERGGIAAEAKKQCDDIAARQRLVEPKKEK